MITSHNLDDLIQLDRDSLSVFCGAGISKDSGLPLANELMQAIIDALPIPEIEHHLYLSAKLPFEAFMETLADNWTIDPLLDIFLDGQPNTNHRLIARLVAEGIVRFVYTTNFDLLLERALIDEGLQKGSDFKVISREEGFAHIDFHAKTPYVLKLHGSADDPESIRTTLSQVAAKSLSEHRMRLIRHCFADGRHTSTLILGYSCSDLFDLVPQIQSIRQSTKQIIHVEHVIGKKPGEWKIAQTQKMCDIGSQHNPFSKYTGAIVQCHTSAFVKELWKSADHLLGPYTASQSTFNWRDHVIKWKTQTPRPVLCLIAGFLSLKVNYYDKAKSLAQKALYLNELSNAPCDTTFWQATRLSAYRILSMALESQGNSIKALELARESMKIAQSCLGEVGILETQVDVARILISCGDLREALHLSENTLSGFRKLKLLRYAIACGNNIGMLNARLGEPKAALSQLKNVLDDAEKTGDLNLVLACYNNLGNVYHRLATYWQDADAIQKDIDCHEYGLDLSQKLGSLDQEANCLNNLGLASMLQGRYQDAEIYLKQALAIAHDIHNIGIETTCRNSFGMVFMKQKDYNKAVQWFERAIELSKSAKDKIGELHAYTNIALCCMHMDNWSLAFKHNQTAKQLALETNEWWPLYTILNTEADIHEHFGHHNEAIKAITELLKLAQSLCDKITEYDSLSRLGVCYRNMGDYREAINYYLSWIEKTRQAYSSRLNILLDTGFCYQHLNDYRKALVYYELAVTAAKKIGDSYTIAKCNNNRGVICMERGEFSLSLKYHHKALEMFRKLGHKLGESSCYLNIAQVERKLNRYYDARKHCSLAMSMKEEIGDQMGISRCLILMSEISKETGDIRELLKQSNGIKKSVFNMKINSLRDTLDYAIAIRDHEKEISILKNIIQSWFEIGQHDQAIPAIEQLRNAAHSHGKKHEESAALKQLAQACRNTDIPRAIVLYKEVLQIDRELGDWEQEMHDLHNIGFAYGLLGKTDTAFAFFEQSLSIARERKQMQAEQQILANISRLKLQ